MRKTHTGFCTGCGADVAGAQVLRRMRQRGGSSFCGAGARYRGSRASTGRVGRVFVRRKGLVVSTLVVLGIIGVALGGWALVGKVTKSDHTITGTLALVDTDSQGGLDEGDLCSGSGGYDDIGPGADVKVTDGKGELIGSSNLGVGKYNGFACSFEFTVESVRDADFYSVEVSHRGGLSFSKAEIEANDWTVGASLGS